MIEKEFTIREPEQPLYIKIILALVLSSYATIVYYFITQEDFAGHITNLLLLTMIVFLWFVIQGLSKKSIHLNFSHKKIKHELNIGPVSIKKK